MRKEYRGETVGGGVEGETARAKSSASLSGTCSAGFSPGGDYLPNCCDALGKTKFASSI